VIQICKNCGAVNSEAVERCCFCDDPFGEHPPVPATRAAAAGATASTPPAPTEGNLAVQPINWRYELADRVEAYRERRRRVIPDGLQTGLPFNKAVEAEELTQEDAEAEETESVPRHDAPLSGEGAGPLTYRSLPLGRPRPQDAERVEIAVTQPELDFGAAESGPEAAMAGAEEVIPVASLHDRRRAGMLDAFFLLLAYAAFAGLFRAFGGRLVLGKFDAAIGAATFVLLYAQYFALFTAFGAETPGMKLRGLRVVGFDGADPTPRQLLWRSFGYLISGGTALLGFLWALVDEDRLTWHDRISQTYITSAPASMEPAEENAESLSDRPGVRWGMRER
jgi:uncharacterized RDD family membrane protein YckC